MAVFIEKQISQSSSVGAYNKVIMEQESYVVGDNASVFLQASSVSLLSNYKTFLQLSTVKEEPQAILIKRIN